MITYKKAKNEIIFDIAIIGAGPVGIAFACGVSKSKIKVAIVEKLPKKKQPKAVDGPKVPIAKVGGGSHRRRENYQRVNSVTFQKASESNCTTH